jgi:hypothetical protein
VTQLLLVFDDQLVRWRNITSSSSKKCGSERVGKFGSFFFGCRNWPGNCWNVNFAEFEFVKKCVIFGCFIVALLIIFMVGMDDVGVD